MVGSSVGRSVHIAYSSLILRCIVLAPKSSLSALILKAGTERRPGLKARLMGQRNRSIYRASSCQDGNPWSTKGFLGPLYCITGI